MKAINNPALTLDDIQAAELALLVARDLAGVYGYKMPTTVEFGKIERALTWILTSEPPYDCWDMLDAGVVYPILWLQHKYPHLPREQLKCPTGALRAYARRHPDIVYSHAAGTVRHPFAIELAAYLDSLASAAAIDAVLDLH